MKRIWLFLVATALLASACAPSVSADATWLPNSALTPGAVNPGVTQEDIQTTICKSGWTETVRPPVSWTDPRKILSIGQYGYSDKNPADYEYDHLIPLELGGAPADTSNLWPQPRNTSPYNASVKDKLENNLRTHVCVGSMSLADAQQAIATDWVAAYQKYTVNGLLPDIAIYPTEP